MITKNDPITISGTVHGDVRPLPIHLWRMDYGIKLLGEVFVVLKNSVCLRVGGALAPSGLTIIQITIFEDC